MFMPNEENSGFSSFIWGSGITPSSNAYGLFSQTADSTPIENTIVESSLIGVGQGQFIVPSNNFKKGDSFQLFMLGHLSSVNGDTLTIKLKEVNTNIILASSGAITMKSATNQHFELQAIFTIREIGIPSTASIFTGAFFNYVRNGSTNLESQIFSNGNSTTFNTTISNQLDITAQWSSASVNNSIYSEILSLTKIY